MKSVKVIQKVLVAFVAMFAVSCSSDETPMPDNDKNIVEIVSSSSDFSLLRAAVVRADLVATLQGNGPFTVFAPTNEAFMKAGFANEASINATPVETLKAVLLYHTVAGKSSAASLPTATNTQVKTSQGENIFITKNAKGVFINGSTVTQADVNAKNGIIHVIDHVLMPPTGNIVETLSSMPDFSLLVAAVVRASQGAVNVKAALEGQGPLTVFAPTNQAFTQAGFATVQAIQAADPATLTKILTGHVLGSQVFSNSIENNLSVKTLNEQNIVFNIGSSVTVKGNGNTTGATITKVNQLTSNGVIHVINQVLLP